MRWTPAISRARHGFLRRHDENSPSFRGASPDGSRQRTGAPRARALTVHERLLVRQLEACSAPSSILQLALFKARRGVGHNLQSTRHSIPRNLRRLLDLMSPKEDRSIIEALSGLEGTITTASGGRRHPISPMVKPELAADLHIQPLRLRRRTGTTDQHEELWFERLVRACKAPGQVVSVFKTAADHHAAGNAALTPSRRLLTIRALKRFRTSQSLQELLSCVNAIAGIYERHSIPYDLQLCLFGAVQAAKAQSVVAMRHYVSKLDELGHEPSVGDCRSLIRELVAQSRLPRSDGTRFGAWQRRDALCLLTGWESTGIGSPGEYRETSLAAFVYRHYTSLVPDYVRALSRLGACEAIWQEWLAYASGVRHTPSSATDTKAADSIRLDAIIIATFKSAMLAAGDAKRASLIKIDAPDPTTKRDNRSPKRPFAVSDSRTARAEPQDPRDRLLEVPLEQHLKHFEKALRLRWVEKGSCSGSHIARDNVS